MTEEVIAEGLEAAKTWIRESIDLQRELVAEAGVHDAARRRCRRSTTATTWPPGSRRSGTDARRAKVTTITAKAERDAATDEATAAIIAELAAGVRGPGEARSRPRSGR